MIYLFLVDKCNVRVLVHLSKYSNSEYNILGGGISQTHTHAHTHTDALFTYIHTIFKQICREKKVGETFRPVALPPAIFILP